MKELMRQCYVTRGKTEFVTWLPEQFAKKGTTVDLKMRGRWEAGWLITDVYNQIILPEAYVREHQRIDFGSIK